MMKPQMERVSSGEDGTRRRSRRALALTAVAVLSAVAAWELVADLRYAPTASATVTTRPAPSEMGSAMAAAASRSGPLSSAPVAATAAPTPTSVPAEGPGTFSWVPGSDLAEGPGQTLRYRVEIEDGLPVDPVHVGRVIHTTLTDDRGWQPLRDVAFERTPIDAELRILLATPKTTDELCLPLDTGGEVSCRVGDRVVLNAKRWTQGVPHFNGALHQYRQYLINHEVGHALGNGHVDCPGAGEPAPVMMQQTKSVGECVPNAWPAVHGR